MYYIVLKYTEESLMAGARGVQLEWSPLPDALDNLLSQVALWRAGDGFSGSCGLVSFRISPSGFLPTEKVKTGPATATIIEHGGSICEEKGTHPKPQKAFHFAMPASYKYTGRLKYLRH